MTKFQRRYVIDESTLFNRIIKTLDKPKTVKELSEEFNDRPMETLRSNLNTMRSHNQLVKIGDKYSVNPIYKRQNNL